MQSLSPASLERQIAREGDRWGLAPVRMPDGRTCVAEVVPVCEARCGVAEVVRRPDRIIATVNDEAPFSETLRNRVSNGETDLARRYKLLDELEARTRAEQEAEQARETARIWGSRKRITALPSGIIPAGLAERRRRR